MKRAAFLAERLNHEAELRHMQTSELIDELTAQIDRPKRRSLGFVNLGESTSGQDSNDVDTMLADGFGRK